MKPIASVSLDLDNQWSYMKTGGHAGWESLPSYLDVCVPRILDFLRRRDLRITFFVIGQDAALEKNREALGRIAEAGHEIANHSFGHEPWLHLYSKSELEEEFEKAEQAIESATGCVPKGFRGPGYSLSPAVLEVLAERGYEYDCSTFPTYIAPLARAYFFLTSSKMSAEEKEKRKKLFGRFSDGFQSLKPFKWRVGTKEIVEVPVTTLPVFKTPVHLSYLMYLATFSRSVAGLYWRTALRMCRMTGTQPSILLHPLDFLCGDDVPELRNFPGMNQPLDHKTDFLEEVFTAFQKDFEIVTVARHAQLAVSEGLDLREPVQTAA